MNSTASIQALWLNELEQLILAVDDGRIATSRRADWVSTIRQDLDYLRDNIFLHNHFGQNQAQFRRIETAFLNLRSE